MKYTSTILAAIIFSQLTAKASANYCQPKPQADIKRVKVETAASFFFRVFPSADKVSFASSNVNYVMDLNTRNVVKIPGIYDPVPMGESVMSIPSKKHGMAYYSIPEILSGTDQPTLLYRSDNMKGVYQSTGLLKKGSGYNIYAIIAAGANEIQYQKLKVTYTPSLKVEPVSEIISLCEGIDIKMPMLSKTAQELSGFDVSAKASKIWRINPDTKTCVEVDNLKMFAAKADFSYDSKKLTFHLSANGFTYRLKENGSGEVDWIERPTAEMSQRVFEYDRVKKTLTKISSNSEGSNAYYPVYQKDGSILYALLEADGEFSFELIRPKRIAALTALNSTEKIRSATTIGKFWNFSCTPHSEVKSQEQLIDITLGLSKNDCLNLAYDYWSNSGHFTTNNSNSTGNDSSRARWTLAHWQEIRKMIGICREL